MLYAIRVTIDPRCESCVIAPLLQKSHADASRATDVEHNLRRFTTCFRRSRARISRGRTALDIDRIFFCMMAVEVLLRESES